MVAGVGDGMGLESFRLELKGTGVQRKGGESINKIYRQEEAEVCGPI